MLRFEELREALVRAADLAQPSEPPVDDLLHRARRRYRRKQAVLPALAAACAIAVVVPVSLISRDEPPRTAKVPVEQASDPRVPDDGDRVRANGTLQMLSGGEARLCVESQAMISMAEDVACPAGVDLLGFVPPPDDGEPRTAGGERTTVEGVLRSGAIEVQSHKAEPIPILAVPDLGPEVPCPAPPGGWPEGNVPYQDTGPDYAGWRDFMARHADLMDQVMQLTASGGRSQVMTFLARNEAQRVQITGELVALFGADRVCSVISQVDLADATPVVDAFVEVASREPGDLYRAGPRFVDGLTRQVVDVAVYAVTPELAELQRQYPPGSVELHPFLVVVP
jgi:hypothetical protein